MGKRVAALVGSGAAAVAVVLALSWKEVTAQFHQLRLRGDPEYLAEILGKPEDSPQGKALRRFCRTERGGVALLQAFVSRATGPGEPLGSSLRKAGFIRAVIGINDQGPWWRLSGLWENSVTSGMRTDPEGEERIRALLPLLSGRKFMLPDCPNRVFTVLRADQSGESLHRMGNPIPSDEIICLVEPHL